MAACRTRTTSAWAERWANTPPSDGRLAIAAPPMKFLLPPNACFVRIWTCVRVRRRIYDNFLLVTLMKNCAPYWPDSRLPRFRVIPRRDTCHTGSRADGDESLSCLLKTRAAQSTDRRWRRNCRAEAGGRTAFCHRRYSDRAAA